MPLGAGTRYRFRGNTRLAFNRGGKVVEAKRFAENKEGILKPAGVAHKIKSRLATRGMATR